jgi:hypothetical protein
LAKRRGRPPKSESKVVEVVESETEVDPNETAHSKHYKAVGKERSTLQKTLKVTDEWYTLSGGTKLVKVSKKNNGNRYTEFVGHLKSPETATFFKKVAKKGLVR